MPDKATAIDPVCQMTVDTATAELTAEYRSFNYGNPYYFCSAGCKVSFDKDPGKFIGAGNRGEAGSH